MSKDGDLRVRRSHDRSDPPAYGTRHNSSILLGDKARVLLKSFLNGGFDDVMTELVINNGCILGGDGDTYEGHIFRVCQ